MMYFLQQSPQLSAMVSLDTVQTYTQPHPLISSDCHHGGGAGLRHNIDRA